MSDLRREPDAYEAGYMGEADEVLHRDKMTMSKWIVGLMALLMLFALVSAVFSAGSLVAAIGPVLAVLFATMVLALVTSLRVTVTRNDVQVQSGPFGPTIPIEGIEHCEAVRYNIWHYGGYGIRYSILDQSWAYNMVGDEGKAVRIHYRSKPNGRLKKVVIASNHPVVLADTINRQRATMGHEVALGDDTELGISDEVVFGGLTVDEDTADSDVAQPAEHSAK